MKIVLISDDQLRFVYEALTRPYDCEVKIVVDTIVYGYVKVCLKISASVRNKDKSREFCIRYTRLDMNVGDLYSFKLTNESYDEFTDHIDQALSKPLDNGKTRVQLINQQVFADENAVSIKYIKRENKVN